MGEQLQKYPPQVYLFMQPAPSTSPENADGTSPPLARPWPDKMAGWSSWHNIHGDSFPGFVVISDFPLFAEYAD
jgi:hypothetical protein